MKIEDLIAELVKEVYWANARGKHTIFLDFSGHVNTINYYYYKGKWQPKKKRSESEDIRLYKHPDIVINQLNLTIEKIKKL